MLERLGGGCFNSTLQYPAHVDRTGIRARTPHTMCPSTRRSAASLRYGLVAGGCLIYFGDQMLECLGGGGMLQLSITIPGVRHLFPVSHFFLNIS
jgi:hypothetical protein